MKKKRNTGLLILLIILLVIGVVTFTYRILLDENALTVVERNFINKSKSNLIDIKILNDANVFGSAGKGVFYDYLNALEKEHNLTFNKIAVTDGNNSDGLALTKSYERPDNGKIIYTDHYVIIGKKFESFNINQINGTIGVLSSDLDKVNKYINRNVEYKTYENKSELLEGFEKNEVSYITGANFEYLDVVLDNLYAIVYHMSDLKDYYYINPGPDNIVNSIMNKYYNTWSKDNFNKSFNENEFELFTSKLKITEKEMDLINSKNYSYGFVTNAPYEIKSSGNYGGVTAIYLQKFSTFSGIGFDYKEFNSIDKLKNEIGKGNISLYSDYFKIGSLTSIDVPFEISASIVMNNNDERTFSSVGSLNGLTVYIKENSPIISYFQNAGINVVTYKKDKDIKKLINKNEIIAMDSLDYLIEARSINNISERFKVNTGITYNFRSNSDTMLNRLFTYYISTLDKNSLTYLGIDNYDRATTSGKLISRIMEYALLLIIIIGVGAYVIFKLSKRVHLRKRIKKTDKMKYIDVLTSLKNRNFLNENIQVWNRNTIYPQAIILINLNGIQELNDTYGYTEGDKQIQSFANILIKTQLDNTEIMRTDGNEFVIYMLGYPEKQVLSYIKKLTKEIKNLPHDKGAAIGFSMILDDVKLIDDAINEATEVMKKNKALSSGEQDESKI